MSMTSEGLRPRKVTAMTNHGAALDARPLCERWLETPVMIRADIAAHGKSVADVPRPNLAGCDLLARAMHSLSLGTATFGGFGAEGELVDQLVKISVRDHHWTSIMRPLERLYDELAEMAEEGQAL